jgi:hypothetical protein
MEFAVILAQQPLFRLLGAVIVLILTDINPLYGLAALAVWTLWVYLSLTKFFRSRQ